MSTNPTNKYVIENRPMPHTLPPAANNATSATAIPTVAHVVLSAPPPQSSFQIPLDIQQRLRDPIFRELFNQNLAFQASSHQAFQIFMAQTMGMRPQMPLPPNFVRPPVQLKPVAPTTAAATTATQPSQPVAPPVVKEPAATKYSGIAFKEPTFSKRDLEEFACDSLPEVNSADEEDVDILLAAQRGNYKDNFKKAKACLANGDLSTALIYVNQCLDDSNQKIDENLVFLKVKIHFQLAVQKQLKHHLSIALSILNDHISILPPLKAQKMIARIKYEQYDLKGEMSAFEKILKIKPNDYDAKFYMGVNHFVLGNYEEAEQLFAQVRNLGVLPYNQAIQFCKAKDNEKFLLSINLISSFAEQIKKQPELKSVRFLKAFIHFKLNQFDVAAKELDGYFKAIGTESPAHFAVQLQAKIKVKQLLVQAKKGENFAEAIECFKYLKQKGCNYLLALAEFAIDLYKEKHFQAAFYVYAEMQMVKPTAHAYLNQAKCLIEASFYKEAAPILQAFLKSMPAHPGCQLARKLLTKIYFEMGDYSSTLKISEHLTTAEINILRIASFIKIKDFDKANELMDILLARKKANPNLLKDTSFTKMGSKGMSDKVAACPQFAEITNILFCLTFNKKLSLK